jgi:Tfp pilus assembly protein PilV
MTLIEVMIAVLLLAIGVAGMIAIQVLAMRDEHIAREDNDASRIARDVMEQVHRMPFASVAVTGGFQPPAWLVVPGYAAGQVPVQVDTPDGPSVAQVYQVSWDVASVAGQTSLRNVDVRVAWTDAAERPQAYTSSTLKYDP